MWVMDSMLFCPMKHQFQMLTKNPENIPKDVAYPDNFWFGVTVSTQEETWRIDELRKVKAKVRFVSFEPLLGAICPDLHDIQWVIVGKLTGSRKVKLQNAWLHNVIAATKALGIPIFLKNNLGLPLKVQMFPKVAVEGGCSS
jgi:protein gp37